MNLIPTFIIKPLILLFLAEAVEFFRSKGQLGNDIRLGGIAVEGVLLCGDIHAVQRLDPVEFILHMEAVALGRGPLDPVRLAVEKALQNEALLRGVGQCCHAQRMILPAMGQRIDLHLIPEEIFLIA